MDDGRAYIASTDQVEAAELLMELAAQTLVASDLTVSLCNVAVEQCHQQIGATGERSLHGLMPNLPSARHVCHAFS